MTEPHTKSKISSLRGWYLGRLKKTASWFIAHLDKEGIPRPTTLQEIPPLAKDMLSFMTYPEPEDTYLTSKGIEKSYEDANPAKEIVQMALEMAKELGLLKSGMNLPLRRIWYAFVKAALERGLEGYVYTDASKEKAGDQREASDSDYYDSFGDIIKGDPSLWYKNYGIKNEGKKTFVPPYYEDSTEPTLGDMFTPIMIGVEKTSYFQVLQNMCKMLGLSLYAAGGQSSLSATEDVMKRVDPIMKEKEQKHLDIYAVTDFDPAGYSIAKGIHNHSKIFIERFGGSVDFERLAPLPKHYTDIELEQGLYTVKKKWTKPTTHTFSRGKKKGQTETKGHWGYNPDRSSEIPDGVKLGAIEVIEEREDEGEVDFKKDSMGRYIQGLEIESLPEEPLEELLINPPSYMPSSYTGIARMRFILFDDLIERHGLDKAFKFLIGLKKRDWTTYTGTSLADKVVNVQNVQKIDDIVQQADNPFWKLHTDIEQWIKDYIEDEKNVVANDIDMWLDDVIEQYTDPQHEGYDAITTKELKDELKDKIYKALARNDNRISFDFPEKFKIDKVLIGDQPYNLYEEDFEITIPDDIVNNIKPIADFSKCIALNAQEAVDYLEELQNDLNEDEHIFDREWEIPQVRACQINDDGEAEFLDDDELTTIEADCDKYRTQIRKLHDEIAEYESDIIKLEEQIEDGSEGDSEEIKRLTSLTHSRLDRIEDLTEIGEDRLKRISEMRAKENELKAKLEEIQTDYNKRTEQLQEAHKISLDVVKTTEEKIKELKKQLKAQTAKPEPEPKPEIKKPEPKEPESKKSIAEQWEETKFKKFEEKEKQKEKDAKEVFTYWEGSDVLNPKIYKRRIQLYYASTDNLPKTIQGLVDEKLGTIEKLYKKSLPKIKQEIEDNKKLPKGQELTTQLSLFIGDLNRYNTDIKKLFHYGR